MGLPTKVAELMAQMDGSVYVERVALYDNKQRTRAKKAIKKAFKLQMENKGFTLVEVLAECPTHLRLTPEETEKWVKENMVPVFPLGVKKDLKEIEPLAEVPPPIYDSDRVLEVIEGSAEQIPRYCKDFPKEINERDIALKLAGAGGDGAQTAAMLITMAAINEGFDSTHIPSYGPESRGGTSYADVHIAKEEVLSPASPTPHILVAFNSPSLAKFGPHVLPGGTIVYDSSVISDLPELTSGVHAFGVPFTEIANDLGKVVVKNVVALGALQAATGIFPQETFLTAIRMALKEKCALIPLNEQAFSWGVKSIQKA
jgi:2-oxoisovalerate ferredoxin oxidoreductase beta subunit